MSFKENLLNKIRINQLSRKVLASIGSAESGLKIDKDAMRSLLEISPYQYQKERDLDLYIQKGDGELSRILVLDSGVFEVVHHIDLAGHASVDYSDTGKRSATS